VTLARNQHGTSEDDNHQDHQTADNHIDGIQSTGATTARTRRGTGRRGAGGSLLLTLGLLRGIRQERIHSLELRVLLEQLLKLAGRQVPVAGSR
jgi:hypothetical protein